jgi:hypothetical protein
MFGIICKPQRCAPLAQLDRASGYEPEGREFESLRARHLTPDTCPNFPVLRLLECPTMADTFKQSKSLFKIYRDYMKHEDDLLNHRTTWLLVIQGFLFATLGVLGEWILPNKTPDLLRTERQFLVFVLAIVGLTIASVAYLSIKAANDAIDSLEKKWNNLRIRYEGWELLPDIAGGGHPKAKGRGKKPALWIPRVIFLAWLAVLGMAVKDKIYTEKAETVPASTSNSMIHR